MILLLDVGNSSIKWLITDEYCDISPSAIVGRLAYRADDSWSELWKAIDEHVDLYKLQQPINWAISSVKPTVTQQLVAANNPWGLAAPYIASSTKQFGNLTNAYNNPLKMGVDRWLAMIAASDEGRESVLVIDCGTAITVDCVAPNGIHKGGFITAGMHTQLQALLSNTERVFSDELVPSFDIAFADDTERCVENGLKAQLYGYFCQCIGQAVDNDCRTVILAGGGSNWAEGLLSKACSRFGVDFRSDPLVIFKGLLSAYRKEYKKI
ncbi:MAG: type III pantothenate kinase [Kangiellaceae bacterium]|jgi:type III pantothenate kinase|nr:type III pantothenate kinase [Kangiellaceae bacterium]